MKLPRHINLTIEHNPHKGSYLTIEQFEEFPGDDPYYDWADGERDKAIAADSMWVIQWYPDTPIGFLAVAASTFEAALDAANSVEG